MINYHKIKKTLKMQTKGESYTSVSQMNVLGWHIGLGYFADVVVRDINIIGNQSKRERFVNMETKLCKDNSAEMSLFTPEFITGILIIRVISI